MTDTDQGVVILLVDDDPLVLEALVATFELYAWTVYTAELGEDALRQMKERLDLDLVLLDVHLPDISGFEVLERSQEAGIVAPVVMISTSAEDEDKLRALDLGVQDYFTKPFDPDVLKERIEEIVGLGRQTGTLPDERFRIGDVLVDLGKGVVHQGDQVQALPESEHNLLCLLYQHRGTAVSRKRLLEEGLQVDQDEVAFSAALRAFYDLIDKHIQVLQQLIEPDPAKPKYLQRVFGQGYRLRV